MLLLANRFRIFIDFLVPSCRSVFTPFLKPQEMSDSYSKAVWELQAAFLKPPGGLFLVPMQLGKLLHNSGGKSYKFCEICQAFCKR
jgi:hypothetical protein